MISGPLMHTDCFIKTESLFRESASGDGAAAVVPLAPIDFSHSLSSCPSSLTLTQHPCGPTESNEHH